MFFCDDRTPLVRICCWMVFGSTVKMNPKTSSPHFLSRCNLFLRLHEAKKRIKETSLLNEILPQSQCIQVGYDQLRLQKKGWGI